MKIVYQKGAQTLRGEVAIDKKGLSLLDWGELANVQLPYGCRSGTCGSCRVKVDSGAELLETRTPSEVDTLERCHDGPDIRLACRALIAVDTRGEITVSLAPPAPDLAE